MNIRIQDPKPRLIEQRSPIKPTSVASVVKPIAVTRALPLTQRSVAHPIPKLSER